MSFEREEEQLTVMGVGGMSGTEFRVHLSCVLFQHSMFSMGLNDLESNVVLSLLLLSQFAIENTSGLNITVLTRDYGSSKIGYCCSIDIKFQFF